MTQKKWIRRPWVIGISVLLGLGLISYLAFKKKPELQLPDGVTLTAKVEKGDVTEKIEETARLAPLKVVRIKANATGRVNKLAVYEGDTVKAGQLLAVIQPGRPGEQFQPSSVLSPMSGVVIERNVEEGDMVTSGLSEYNGGTQVMMVARLDSMVADFQVNEVDIARVKAGMPAILRVASFQGLTFSGSVLRVSPKAKPLDGSNLNIFPAKILVQGEHLELKPGMSAVVELISGSRVGVLTLPVEAVFDDDGKMNVYKVVKGQKEFAKTPVKTGLSDNHKVEIISGLVLGDEVSKVRPLKEIPERK